MVPPLFTNQLDLYTHSFNGISAGMLLLSFQSSCIQGDLPRQLSWEILSLHFPLCRCSSCTLPVHLHIAIFGLCYILYISLEKVNLFSHNFFHHDIACNKDARNFFEIRERGDGMSRFYRYKLPPWLRQFLYALERAMTPLLIYQLLRTIILPTTLDVFLLAVFVFLYIAFYLHWI